MAANGLNQNKRCQFYFLHWAVYPLPPYHVEQCLVGLKILQYVEKLL